MIIRVRKQCFKSGVPTMLFSPATVVCSIYLSIYLSVYVCDDIKSFPLVKINLKLWALDTLCPIILLHNHTTIAHTGATSSPCQNYLFNAMTITYMMTKMPPSYLTNDSYSTLLLQSSCHQSTAGPFPPRQHHFYDQLLFGQLYCISTLTLHHHINLPCTTLHYQTLLSKSPLWNPLLTQPHCCHCLYHNTAMITCLPLQPPHYHFHLVLSSNSLQDRNWNPPSNTNTTFYQ